MFGLEKKLWAPARRREPVARLAIFSPEATAILDESRLSERENRVLSVLYKRETQRTSKIKLEPIEDEPEDALGVTDAKVAEEAPASEQLSASGHPSMGDGQASPSASALPLSPDDDEKKKLWTRSKLQSKGERN